MTGSGEAVEVYSLGRSPKEHELSGARPVSAVATRRSQPSGGERASRPTSPPERLAMSVATYLPPQRPSTASSNVGALITSELPTSASLPTLIKADLVQLGVGRPVLPKKPTAEEELSICRRRVRTLEVELKKAKGALVRDRDLAEHGMTKSEFEKQVSLWNHAKEQLQRQHASELEHVRAEYEERLASTTKDYDSKLKSSASDLNASAEARLEALKVDMEAKASAKAEREREERVSTLRKQSVRRMMNAGLVNAWAAWTDLWEAKTYAINRLREVANRLRKPEMALAFSFLVRHRETNTQMALARATMKKEESLLSMRAELEEMVRTLTAEYERKLAVAEESKRIALEHQRIELTGTAEQLAEVRVAKERDARIEQLRRQSVRRILNADLCNGWSAWLELWEARSTALRRLREVGNKLRAPELSEAFGLWASAWHLTQAKKAEAARRKNDVLLFTSDARCRELQTALDAARAEVAAGVLERARLKEQIAELDGGAEEADRLHEQQLAEQKEARVELLRKQASRRLLHSGLHAGWSAWRESHTARQEALAKLRAVGNKLRVPALAQTVDFWWGEAHTAKLEAERSAARTKASSLKGKVASLGAELKRVRDECERRLSAVAAEHEKQIERLKLEMSGASDAQQAARVVEEREARIELLRRQIGRRLLYQGTTRGWTAWHDHWMARSHALRTLRRVASRLQKPELAFAFGIWWDEIAEQKRQVAAIKRRKKAAKREQDVAELRAQLHALRADSDAKLAAADAERAQLQQQLTMLTGGAAEAEALHAAQAEKEKAARVEMCRRQSMRRMLNRDLSAAWMAWIELAEAKRDALRQLRECGARLRSPELAEAFGVWAEMCAERRQAAAVTTYKVKAERLEKDLERVLRELQRTTTEYEAKLASAHTAMEKALHQQRVELCGSAEEIAALKGDKEREARVELMRRQVTRRMMNAGLVNAWTAWTELWQARAYAIARLREVGHRLQAPELSTAWHLWSSSSEEAKRQAEMARLEREANSLEARLRRSRFEAGQLELLKTANMEEIQALKAAVLELTQQCRTNDAELAAAAEMRLKWDSAVDAAAKANEAAALAERLRSEAEEDADEQRKAAQALLEKLLAEQRQSFDNERERLMQSHGLGAEYRSSVTEAFEEELRRYRVEMTGMVQELQAAREEASVRAKELKDVQEAKARLESAMNASKTANERLEKELKDERAKPREQKKSPPKEKPEPKEKPAKKGSSALGKIDLDEGPDAPPVTQQIAAALAKNAGKVLDLFREWDADGDGEVSKKEFRKAMPAIGLDVPVREVDSLFDSWDKDGGGSLTLKEITKILRSEAKNLNAPAEKAKATATAISAANKFKKGVGDRRPSAVEAPPA